MLSDRWARERGQMKFALPILLILFVAGFFVFTYNSGYGYDAIEYLVIGRSLHDGYSLFAFSPSKSPGIYYVAAAFLKLFPEAGHVEISALITALLVLTLAAAYAIVRATHGSTAAAVTVMLVAASACFMEMNFLETEGAVFLLALPTLPCLRNGVRTESSAWFALAGFWIGVAAFFKTIALFYLIGATVFTVIWLWRRQGHPVASAWRPIAALWIGTGLAAAMPTLFYVMRGEGFPYVYWTYVFPLLHYERDTIYLSKLVTKLGWFWILLLTSLCVALHPRVRHVFSMSVYPAAALALGLTALLALLKNQASHYVFPAAGFLCVFMALTWTAWAEIHPHSKRILSTVMLAGALLAAGSLVAYRPSALRRLASWRDHSREAELGRQLQMLVAEDQTLLCMDHPLPYWLARRYPAIPTVTTHVQFAHLWRRRPSLLIEALDDPRLALVEFDPARPYLRAPSLQRDPQAHDRLREFSDALAGRFQPVELKDSPYRFWRRR